MERWTRREALRLGGVALGALVLGRRSAADVVLAQSAGVAYELAAGPARVLAGGQNATLWTYNGSFPGPVLRVREGEQVRIRLTNRLSEPTNLHFHGLHIPSDVDDPFLEVPPGGSTLYEFTVPYGSAGTYWYHPHLHGRVARQLFAGLAGALLVEEPFDASPGLGDAEEHVLVLKDLSLVDGAPAPHLPFDWMNGKEGALRLVNGTLRPVLTPQRSIVRLRLINASNARYYRVRLDGHVLRLIATDGGLIERPQFFRELLLAPGERAEVLIRLWRRGQFPLLDLPYDRGALMAGHGHGMPHSPMGPSSGHQLVGGEILLWLDTTRVSERVSMPMTGAAVERLDQAPIAATRRLVLSEGMMGRFLINGRRFDPQRIDIDGQAGTVEVWELENRGGMDHPFHLHAYPFQVLSRNGLTAPFRAWKDVVNLPPGDRVRIAVPLRDFGGRTVFHCHIAEHEDLGMMGVLSV